METPQASIGLLGGLAIGAFLFLETSLLALPHAIACWSAWNYTILTPLLLLITLLPLLYGVHSSSHHWQSRSRAWGVFFLLVACVGLAVGHLAKDIPAGMALLLLQWIVLVSFSSALYEPRHGRERIGLHLALGFLLFLLFNFAYAFAFTYAYTLDFFRGAGLLILFIAALLAMLPAALRGLRAPQLFIAQQLPCWWL